MQGMQGMPMMGNPSMGGNQNLFGQINNTQNNQQGPQIPQNFNSMGMGMNPMMGNPLFANSALIAQMQKMTD